MSDNVTLIKKPDLKCYGTSRMHERGMSVMVSFNRPLTDEELRFFDECSKRTAALMGAII